MMRRNAAGRVLWASAALTAALCQAATPAAAMTVSGVGVPDTYALDGTTLRLNGAGLRTMTLLEVGVYVAALYVVQPGHDAKSVEASPGSKVLVLTFVRSASKAQVEQEYRDGQRRACGAGGCPPADAPDFERLVSLIPAVKPGDTTTYVFTPQGVRVLANNVLLADFTSPDFGFRLLDGFLGARPASTTLRAALLGAS